MELSRASWGPRFWKILHTLAECVGFEKDIITENDEAEAWILLLSTQPLVMPCRICKTHLSEYIRSHRIDSLRAVRGIHRYTWLQNYLYKLHEHVNRLTGVSSTVTKEQLPELYPREKQTEAVAACQRMFQMAFDRQLLKPEDVHRWKAALVRLRTMYSI
jgi:hypothetical protein